MIVVNGKKNSIWLCCLLAESSQMANNLASDFFVCDWLEMHYLSVSSKSSLKWKCFLKSLRTKIEKYKNQTETLEHNSNTQLYNLFLSKNILYFHYASQIYKTYFYNTAHKKYLTHQIDIVLKPRDFFSVCKKSTTKGPRTCSGQ